MDKPLDFDEGAWRRAREPETWRVDEIADMLDTIVQEAGENVATLEREVVELESHPDDRDRIDAIFRAAHNLKGLARIADVEKMVLVARAMEHVLDLYRQGARRPDPEGINLILKSTDAIRDRIIPCLVARKPIDADLEELLRAIVTWDSAAPPPATPLPPQARADMPPAPPAPPAPPRALSEGSPPSSEPESKGVSARGTGVSLPAPAPPEEASIRVRFTRLDDLLNLVGELVIARIRLEKRLGDLRNLAPELERLERRLEAKGSTPTASIVRQHLAPLREDADRLRRVFEELTRDLEESADDFHAISGKMQGQVMRVRMVSLAQLFQKFPRMVRDVAQALGKRVRFEVEGEDTEVDKILLDAMSDPLMHLLRNAVDHGIERPEERSARGKPPEGTLRLRAGQKAGQVFLDVEDDGAGIDPGKIRRVAVERRLLTEGEAAALTDRAAMELIFRPGFSTAIEVTEISGRGVGLDVVRKNIATLKGSLEVEALPGGGTRFRARLPLTVAVIQAMMVSVAGAPLALPMAHVYEVLNVAPDALRPVGDARVLHLRGQSLFVEPLADLLGLPGEASTGADSLSIVVIGFGDHRLGLIVDRTLGKQDLVVKSLGTLLHRIPRVLGSSVLGDGRLILIVDAPAVIEMLQRRRTSGESTKSWRRPQSAPALPGQTEVSPAPPPGPGGVDATRPGRHTARILLVDDSPTVREGARRILSEAGFEVVEAENGVDALARAGRETFDLVSTDVMMPRMDGYELVRHLRELPAYRRTPIVMVSSLGEKMDKVRGFDAGADDYVTKPFDRETLLAAVRNNLRR